ncbi:hypothetical protein [Sphingomonas sp. RS2018]
MTQVPPSGDLDVRAPLKRFRNAHRAPRTQPDAVARQAKLSLAAIRGFDTRENALEFLHAECAELGGRPIDVASADEAGLTAAIERLNAVLANGQP